MLRASALFYAVTVALLIGTITSSLVLLAHFRDVEMEHWLAQERATSNARSAVVLAGARDLSGPVPRAVDLFGDGQDSAWVIAEAYGLLQHVAVRATAGDDEVTLSAYSGRWSEDDRVLVLGGSAVSAVSLGGDTRITGDVVVPHGDVRRGYIEGRPFNGTQLVNGHISASTPGDVALDPAVVDRATPWCRRAPIAHGQERTWAAVQHAADSLEAFRHLTVVDLHGQRRIDNARLIGPLVLRSADTLEIGENVTLEMVVVQAPFISIRSQLPCTVQCFAEQGVYVGPGAVLRYPSALVVVAPDTVPGAYTISIDSALVEGSVVCTADHARSDVRTRVSVAPGAQVRGEVFCQGAVEHRGVLEGILLANGLSLRTSSSTYQGHLLDADLHRPPPGGAMGGLATGPVQHQRVLQWTSPRHQRRARA